MKQDSSNRSLSQNAVRGAKAMRPVDDKNIVHSIYRAVGILSLLVSNKVPCELDALASEAGLKKTTAHRILQTLVDLGMVERDSQTRRYKAGRRLVSLGLAAYSNFDLSHIAAPILESIRDALGETTNLTVLEGNEIVIVERFPSPHLLNLVLNRGSRLPVHCTATGKAILAHLAPDCRAALVNILTLKQMTPKTLVTAEALLADLEITRNQGYAVCDEEFAIGQIGYAAPVLGPNGECLAAVNISFILARHPDRSVHEQFIEQILNAGELISRGMGYAGPWPSTDADSQSANN